MGRLTRRYDIPPPPPPHLLECGFSLRHGSNYFFNWNSHCTNQALKKTSTTLNLTMPNSISTMPSRNTLKNPSIKISTTRRGNNTNQRLRKQESRSSQLRGVCGADVLPEFFLKGRRRGGVIQILLAWIHFYFILFYFETSGGERLSMASVLACCSFFF